MSYHTIVNRVVIIGFFFFLMACKKSGDKLGDSPSPATLTLMYNGTKYTYVTPEWSFGTQTSISLQLEDKPDKPFGIIALMRSSLGPGYCGIVLPHNYCDRSSISFADSQAGCTITFPQIDKNGKPIDSSQVYWYSTGDLTYSTFNCTYKKEYDVWTASYFTSSICDISGKFNMIAKNGNNQNVTLTGDFKQYSVYSH